MGAERGLCDDSIKIITDAHASLRGQLKERGRGGEREGMMIYWKLLEGGGRAVNDARILFSSFLFFMAVRTNNYG